MNRLINFGQSPEVKVEGLTYFNKNLYLLIELKPQKNCYQKIFMNALTPICGHQALQTLILNYYALVIVQRDVIDNLTTPKIL